MQKPSLGIYESPAAQKPQQEEGLDMAPGEKASEKPSIKNDGETESPAALIDSDPEAALNVNKPSLDINPTPPARAT